MRKSYDQGQVVSLVAKAETGSRFVRWMNNATGSHPSFNIRMDSDKWVFAEFELIDFNQLEVEIAPLPRTKLFELEVKNTGTGNGRVVISPIAISYHDGEVVSLGAQPSTGSRFVRWMNGASGTNLTCEVEMNSPKLVFAEFELLNISDMHEMTSSVSAVAGAEVVAKSGGSNKKWIGHSGHFIDNEDGTVTDIRSGLMWMRYSIGQAWSNEIPSGEARLFSLVEAQAIKSNCSGFNDWILPTYDEVKTLIYQNRNQRLYQQVFPTQSDGYFWSSSFSEVGFHKKHIIFSTHTGSFALSKVENNLNYIRLVRFEEIPSFVLNSTSTGSGQGTLKCLLKSGELIKKPDGERYLEGSVISFTAVPADGSKFMGWAGSDESDGLNCTVTMNSAKTITASFARIPAFSLTCNREGNGDGAVNWALQSGKVENMPEGVWFLEGSVVTLTTVPTDGSRFKCWRGDASGTLPSCKLTFNSAKSVVAVFEALVAFALTVKTSGDGQGSVKHSRDAESYFDGSSVTLTAIAAPGSLFCGWHGDAAGLDETCTVSMDAVKTVTAEFQSMTIADLATTVEYESAEHTSMKNGESAIIFYLRIRNAGDKQIQISLPRATYVNHRGEEVEQSVWLTGLILGGDVAKIRAGTFRKVGLVFYKSSLNGIAKGERLYLTVEQSKPAQRLSFVFRCTHAGSGAFELIQATSQARDEPPDTKQLEQELSALRWEVAKLRIELATAKLQLALASDSANPAKDDLIDAEDEDDEDDAPVAAEAESPIKTIVTWLAKQDRVTVAALRELLLPLDLLPNAVINELNELALDLTGDMALEESADDILINCSTLDEILATADWSQNR